MTSSWSFASECCNITAAAVLEKAELKNTSMGSEKLFEKVQCTAAELHANKSHSTPSMDGWIYGWLAGWMDGVVCRHLHIHDQIYKEHGVNVGNGLQRKSQTSHKIICMGVALKYKTVPPIVRSYPIIVLS